MKRVQLHPDPETWKPLLERPARHVSDLVSSVQPILDRVRKEGDRALRELTRQFDHVYLDTFRVTPEEYSGVESSISTELSESISVAIENIQRFHEAQRTQPEWIETFRGVRCQRRPVPIDSVGLYVPGGSAPLFSTLLMLAIPARIAGCKRIVVCTPPRRDGSIHPAILFVSRQLGISEVYKLGGAQAIAAMALGTSSIPHVDKIFGPGNTYVTAAKQLVQQAGVAIDMPAGPSEVAVIADEFANPAFVASDLLSQAEHGTDSQVICLSPSADLLDEVEEQVTRQLASLPRRDIAAGALKKSLLIQTASIPEALDFSNAYAPEHLILQCQHAVLLMDQIRNAGSVFVGAFAPESAGDYASGTNHTLPTAGFARAYSGVSVDSFVKKITFQEISKPGLKALGPHIENLARAESLEAHAAAVSVRLDAISKEDDARESAQLPERTATIHRHTNETDIRVYLNLDGSGHRSIHTGLGFFDHLLDQLIRHSRCDARIFVSGDLHIDEHHTIEDTALALGAAFDRALGDKKGIERYGFLLPMDDALVQAAIDFSGRPWLVWEADFNREKVGDVPTEMFHHFFKSFCDAARCNLNLKIEGDNEHHMIEAAFKAVGKSIRMAVHRDTAHMEIPSTKGVL